MSNFDFNAHKQLCNCQTNVQQAIEQANEKAEMGHYIVCITDAGEVLVLPKYAAYVRDDITEKVYDTERGYNFTSKVG